MTSTSPTIGPRPALRPRNAARSGFTLTEALLATVIVGVGVLSSLNLFCACTESANKAAQATTGRTLAENVRESMAALAFCDPVSGATAWGPETGETSPTQYDDVDDYDGTDGKGTTFNPPIDGMRNPIPALAQYTQVVTIMPVNPNDPSANENEASPTLPKGAYTGALRVRVRIYFQQTPASVKSLVFTESWVRVNN
jgi:hypothetical protein